MKELFSKISERVWMEGDPNRDRSTGLAIFGTLEIVLGILCFSLAMLLMIIVSAAGLSGMKQSHFIMVMALLLYLTAWFCVMGLGSIKARRWARALVLVGAWVAIFFGTMAMAFALYVLPAVYDIFADSGIMHPMAAMGLLYFAVVVMLLLQVVFPLAAIIFYNLHGVRATCEKKYTAPSWTDRAPLPLLVMSFIAVLGSLSLIIGVTFNYSVCMFGTLWSGTKGFIVALLISVAFALVGFGAFKRKMVAWWGAYVLVLTSCTSMMLTFSEISMNDLYTSMGYSEAQILNLDRILPMDPAVLTFSSCIWGIMACIYLVWVRDCFSPEKDKSGVKSYAQRKAEEAALEPERPRGPRMRLDD
jgi:hypothetical protein